MTRELVNAQTQWFLRDGAALVDLVGTIGRYRAGIAALTPLLATALPASRRLHLEQEAHRHVDAGIPVDLAADVAALRVLALAPSITRIAGESRSSVADTAHVYLEIGERLHIAELAAKASAMPTPDYYDRLAVGQALSQVDSALAAFVRDVLAGGKGGVEAWLGRQGDRLARVRGTLEEIAGEGATSVSRLLVAAGQLRDYAAGLGAP
jgi:glutamate dehydrogenase